MVSGRSPVFAGCTQLQVHTDFRSGSLKRRIKLSGYWWAKHFFSVSKPPS